VRGNISRSGLVAASVKTSVIPNVQIKGTLSDGSRVLFRPIRPDDKDGLRRGLEQLSPQSRYRRFFRDIDHFSDEELAYLTELDFENHFAWLAVLPDAPGEPGVGVGRWIRLKDDPTAAEAAVTVIDAYQGQGLGRMLLHLAAASAIERGVRRFRAYALADNRPILTLLRQLGAIEGRWDGGVLDLTVPLPSDPGELEGTPAPLILKATATGDLGAGTRSGGGAGCCFDG
jgi:GNAT superfamily N-acetyltransferase